LPSSLMASALPAILAPGVSQIQSHKFVKKKKKKTKPRTPTETILYIT
jgi:hypothetical protein